MRLIFKISTELNIMVLLVCKISLIGNYLNILQKLGMRI